MSGYFEQDPPPYEMPEVTPNPDLAASRLSKTPRHLIANNVVTLAEIGQTDRRVVELLDTSFTDGSEVVFTQRDLNDRRRPRRTAWELSRQGPAGVAASRLMLATLMELPRKRRKAT